MLWSARLEVRHYEDMTNNTDSQSTDTGREVLDALAEIENTNGEPSQEMLDRFANAVDAHPGQKRTAPLPKVRPSRHRRP